jgi:hypothetical protein
MFFLLGHCNLWQTTLKFGQHVEDETQNFSVGTHKRLAAPTKSMCQEPENFAQRYGAPGCDA